VLTSCSGSSSGSYSGTFYPQDTNTYAKAEAEADAHAENDDADPLLPRNFKDDSAQPV
jgi:hypothetical protein